MRLKNFLKREGISDAEFAQQIGVTRFAVFRWRKELRLPRAEHKILIHKITKGKVTYRDWYDWYGLGRSKDC